MTIKNRHRIELEIAEAVITAAVKEGYTFMIDNGDDDERIKTSTKEETLKAMFATDEEHLFFVKNGKTICQISSAKCGAVAERTIA